MTATLGGGCYFHFTDEEPRGLSHLFKVRLLAQGRPRIRGQVSLVTWPMLRTTSSSEGSEASTEGVPDLDPRSG